MSGRSLAWSLPTTPSSLWTSYGVIHTSVPEQYRMTDTHYDGDLHRCLGYICSVTSDAHVFDIEARAKTFV